jgi:hypothetical protein
MIAQIRILESLTDIGFVPDGRSLHFVGQAVNCKTAGPEIGPLVHAAANGQNSLERDMSCHQVKGSLYDLRPDEGQRAAS